MDKKAVILAVKSIGGGVHKRLDENRELYQLLQRDAPEFLETHPWVANWFQSEDEFCRALIDAIPENQSGLFSNCPVRPIPWEQG